MNALPAPPALPVGLAQLRRKLLDLTGRNRLINFKYTVGKSLQFSEGYYVSIYQRLVENNTHVPILGVPQPTRDAWVERNGRAQRPDVRDWATSAGIRTAYEMPDTANTGQDVALRAVMYADDLSRHCRKIDREAKLAIEETGANMLFLVLGFLEFPENRNSDKMFTAPLLSIPVTLNDREIEGGQQFSLQYTGDDIAENLSLREKLWNDFGLALSDLPEEQEGIERYIDEVRRLIQDEPRFAVRHRVSLCLLSFSNMLLVRDLDPAKWPVSDIGNSLTDHPIVRQVFEGRADAGGEGLRIAEEHLVEEGPGAAIPLVYDADSSQHSALVDVLSLKKNLVIEGPPGTGKSQTITNLIAASLSEGKKVLFVAEKLAALEVVKSRLALAGLSPFVLELHSNKANKKELLEDISKRMDFRSDRPANLTRDQQQLETYRRDLKAYSDLINSVAHNAFGLTLHEIVWRAETRRKWLGESERMLSQIDVDGSTQVSEFEFLARTDSLDFLSSQYSAVGRFDPDCAFWGFHPENLLPGDDEKIIRLLEGAMVWVSDLVGASAQLTEDIGGKLRTLTAAGCREQLVALKGLIQTSNEQLPLHLIPRFFEDDASGVIAAREIDAFSRQVALFHSLGGTVATGLKRETSVSGLDVSELKSLLRQAGRLGTQLGTVEDLRGLHQFLVASERSLSEANARITELLAKSNIPYDGSLENLEQLLQFTDVVLAAPEEHFHLQTPGLARDRATEEIERLETLQSQWSSLEESLGEVLYLDNLPQEEDIKRAILTLREGDTWYRIFQSEWRQAIELHATLLRTKRRFPSHKRLEHLEQLVKLRSLKAAWKSGSTWSTLLGFAAPESLFPLEGYLALARWNRRFKAVSADMRSGQLDPASFTAGLSRTQQHQFSLVKVDISSAISAFKGIVGKLRQLSESSRPLAAEQLTAMTRDLLAGMDTSLPWLELEAERNASFSQIVAGCDAALERRGLREQLQDNPRVKALLGDRYAGEDTDCSPVIQALVFGQAIDKLNVLPEIKAKLRARHPIEACRGLTASLEPVRAGMLRVEELSRSLSEFGPFDLDSFTRTSEDDELVTFTRALQNTIQRAIDGQDLLIPWSLYLTRRKEAAELGLNQFVQLLEEKRLEPDKITHAYGYCTYSTIIRSAFRTHPHLGSFAGLKHNQVRDAFKRLDSDIIKLRGREIALQCASNVSLPPGRNGPRVDDRTELVLLSYLIGLKKPRMPVRKILTRAGRAVQELKPCFMMGPQAVAQYLAPGEITFDLVIMDEASQLKPEEAIGAIARGGQLVVVGDAKQLPPTSFFAKMVPDGPDADDSFVTTDAESILDVCSSQFRPIRSLRWHYRSQHHSLIAFSNHSFYNGKLVIFPSPYGQGEKLGIRAVYLADAIYADQINLREANRVVVAALDHIASRPDDSLGIVTLNVKQRDLIAELLEERMMSEQRAGSFNERWAKAGQPLFIKNLENVQGDERDAIIISTTFGKPPGSSAVRQNFGPISSQGGWRRLNVLFTRAKKSVTIFTSLRPEDISVDRTTPDGTKALRNYLEYARSGALTTVIETGREPDSDFEVSIMDMLKSKGYEVTPQLGVAGYRIDIAVKHPDRPGSYLAAIECDGASYHSAFSVRDRDRIRQEILESVGWRGRIWRIWSTDWFRTPRQETDKLMAWLADLREKWVPEHASGKAWIEEGQTLSQTSQSPATGAERVGIANQSDNDGYEVNSDQSETDAVLAVELGDVVRYVDLAHPKDVLTIRIANDGHDGGEAVVSVSDPIAQALLSAVVSKVVQVRSDGGATRTLQVLEIVHQEP